MASSSSPYPRFWRHGTTCASFVNKTGLFFAGDGLARLSDSNNPHDNPIVSRIAQKVHLFANRMLVSVAGNGAWCQYILDILRPRIESPTQGAHWTCQRCAQFVFDTQAEGPGPLLEKLNKQPGALDGQFCSFMFGAYEQNEAKLFFANDRRVQQIFEGDAYDPYQDVNQDQGMSCKVMGSGAKIAEDKMHKLSTLSDVNGVNITRGDLSHFEDQLVLLLSGMKEACDKNINTGGFILVYFMPPPPGEAHIVYDEFHDWIPLDITMLRADMYYRLHEAAVEAGSFMADDYLGQFSRFSLLYEAKIEELIEDSKIVLEKQERLLQYLERRRKERLLQYLERRRKFKWFKLYSPI